MTNGWSSASFEDCVGKVTYTTKILRKDFLEDGPWPVVSQEDGLINGYWDNEGDLFKVSTPVVVFGDHTRALKYVDFDFVLGADGVKILRPREFLVPKFFFYQLQGASLKSLGYARHYRLLNELEIGYPSKSEQRRIVGILDEALAAIAAVRANTEQNLRNAGGAFESYLNGVFTQRGPGWVEKPLVACLNLITYGFTNPMPTTHEGPYMITAKNVVGGRIDFASTRRTSRYAFETLLTDKSRPKIGDVLLTKDGTLGRVAVVDRTDVCINQSVALLRPNGQMNPHFMRYLLSSLDYQRRMVDAAGGTTVKHIYITRVDKMSVVFPQSSQEQQTIVANLDLLKSETQRLARLYERKIAALEALKQSLFHQAFTGAL